MLRFVALFNIRIGKYRINYRTMNQLKIIVFPEGTAFANAEAECPNRTSRVLAVVFYSSTTI